MKLGPTTRIAWGGVETLLRLCRRMCGGGSAPPEVITLMISGCARSWCTAPDSDEGLPEGHSHSAHRAAQPRRDHATASNSSGPSRPAKSALQTILQTDPLPAQPNGLQGGK
jgi:hypothetical protein